MKKNICLALALAGMASALLSVSAQSTRQDASAAFQYFLPKDNNSLYNNGFGGELQYRYWFCDSLALAPAIGASRLNVARQNEVATGTDGTVDILPLGADVVVNIADLPPLRINLQAGIRYLFVSSSATAQNIAGKTVDMSIDNGAVWRVGLDVDYALTAHLGLFGDAGYQQDISKQSISTVDGPLRDNTFRAFILELGMRYRF